MAFRIATATYSDIKEEASVTFSDKFELLDWLEKLDCLKDILSEVEYRYNLEIDALSSDEKIAANILGHNNDSP